MPFLLPSASSFWLRTWGRASALAWWEQRFLPLLILPLCRVWWLFCENNLSAKPADTSGPSRSPFVFCFPAYTQSCPCFCTAGGYRLSKRSRTQIVKPCVLWHLHLHLKHTDVWNMPVSGRWGKVLQNVVVSLCWCWRELRNPLLCLEHMNVTGNTKVVSGCRSLCELCTNALLLACLYFSRTCL